MEPTSEMTCISNKHQAMGNVQRIIAILVSFYHVMARPLPSVLGATTRFELWSPLLQLHLRNKTRSKTPWMGSGSCRT
jgi:hypothetical protein